jgi:aspartate/methionine/tyrosine aminotransferase
MDAAKYGKTKYTTVVGDYELREAICRDLRRRKQVTYTPENIIVSHLPILHRQTAIILGIIRYS